MNSSRAFIDANTFDIVKVDAEKVGSDMVNAYLHRRWNLNEKFYHSYSFPYQDNGLLLLRFNKKKKQIIVTKFE